MENVTEKREEKKFLLFFVLRFFVATEVPPPPPPQIVQKNTLEFIASVVWNVLPWGESSLAAVLANESRFRGMMTVSRETAGT